MANIYVNTAGSNTSPFDTWAKAATTLAAALAVATNADTVWIKNTHSEVQGTTITETFPTSPGCKALCTSDATEPPTSITTGAKVRTNATVLIALDGCVYGYGTEFVVGETTAGNVGLQVGSTGVAQAQVWDTCKFTLAETGASGSIKLGHVATTIGKDALIELLSPTMKFANTGQTINLQCGRTHIVNMALDAAGSIPTTLFKTVVDCDCDVLVESSDLSARAFTNLVNWGTACQAKIDFRNCKLPASITVVTGTNPGPGGPVVRMHNCDSGNTNYRFAEHRYEGSIIDEHTLIETGGASDGVTGNSFKMVSSANTQFWHPLKSPEFVQKVTSVGSALTCTVEILHDSATALKDSEVWLELQYLKDAGDPLGAILTDRSADVLAAGANQTSSSVTWTTTGMANPNKQKLEVTFTPQQKGYVICRVCLAKASYTIYVDNKPTIA